MSDNSVIISIIIPCRNEREFIGKCLESITANDYPKDRLEVLVVDGMSQDKTREIVERYVEQHPFIMLLDNNKKITPCALNIGIKHARGEIIMRMDAHATYEKDYILKCVEYLSEYNADNVGGVWKIVSRDNTLVGKAIALSLSHPFGIGNAYYRFVSKGARWVDTVPFFCCKKEVFEKIGLFNENLPRGQDMEFSLRLKKERRKTLLVPRIVSYYYARSDFKSFYSHSFRNGVWAVYPFRFTDIMPVSLRHLIPLMFVLSLVGSLILSLSSGFFWWVFLGIILLYGMVNLYFSSRIATKEKDLRLLFVMPATFTIFHFCYGLGSVLGLAKCIFSRNFWKNLRIIFSGSE